MERFQELLAHVASSKQEVQRLNDEIVMSEEELKVVENQLKMLANQPEEEVQQHTTQQTQRRIAWEQMRTRMLVMGYDESELPPAPKDKATASDVGSQREDSSMIGDDEGTEQPSRSNKRQRKETYPEYYTLNRRNLVDRELAEDDDWIDKAKFNKTVPKDEQDDYECVYERKGNKNVLVGYIEFDEDEAKDKTTPNKTPNKTTPNETTPNETTPNKTTPNKQLTLRTPSGR